MEPFPKGSEMEPEIPEEVKEAMMESTTNVKVLSASLHKLGYSVELRFEVIAPSVFKNLYLVYPYG